MFDTKEGAGIFATRSWTCFVDVIGAVAITVEVVVGECFMVGVWNNVGMVVVVGLLVLESIEGVGLSTEVGISSGRVKIEKSGQLLSLT